MQYFVYLKHPSRREMSNHAFSSFEEAMSFSVSNTAGFDISICSANDKEDYPMSEVVSFRTIK